MLALRDYVIAIDPGTTESGVCIVSSRDYMPVAFAKIRNEDVPYWIQCKNPRMGNYEHIEAVIERMQGNYLHVGSDVFLTCEWIGRFDVELHDLGITKREYILRREEYQLLCGKEYSRNDKGIRSSLVDRFAYGAPNYGKGKKTAPGWFYGFGADVWQSYGIAVAYIDKCKAMEG